MAKTITEARDAALENAFEAGTGVELDQVDYAVDVYNAAKVYENEMEKTGNEYEAIKKAGESLGESVTGGALSGEAVDVVMDNIPVIAETLTDLGPYGDAAVGAGLLAGYIGYEGYEQYVEDKKSGDGIIPEQSLVPGDANAMADDLARWEDARRRAPGPRKDPIALDLNRDGKITTTSREEGVNFDLDGNGFAEKAGWISGDDALLVRDVNGDGKISNGGELFGDQTELKDGTIAESGFEALSELDSNGDGKISEDDDEFSTLRVWNDKNQDGLSQVDEMQSLSNAFKSVVHM